MALGRLVDELKGVSAGDIDWFDETSTSKTQKITWTERKQRKSESSSFYYSSISFFIIKAYIHKKSSLILNKRNLH